jgi:hypothetical protein
MEKMAIFVEGQTEQKFAESLVYQVAGERRVHIDTVQAYGGSTVPRTFVAVTASRPAPEKQYYVIIYDSSNDSRVLSDIRDHYANLVSQGFREIVGIRDVYPQPPADIPGIRRAFASLVPSGPVSPILVLTLMEIEAWFIAEHNHFPRLHTALSLPAVTAAIGYDPQTHDVQLIPHPADDLKKAYMLAGLGYNKSARHVQRTVANLDYAHIYLHLPARLPGLKVLAECLDRFLT